MAQKAERTSFSTSNNLKAAMLAKGFSDRLAVKETRSFYAGAANDIHLVTGQSDDGPYRTMNITGTTPSFDFILSSDPDLSRIWADAELEVFIASFVPESLTCTFLAPDWTCSILINSVTHTGVDTKKPDAMAKALIKLLNAIP